MLAANLVVTLETDLVDRIVVVEFNETEAALLTGLLVGDYANRVYATVTLKVLPKILLLMIILQATHKELLHGSSGFRPADFLSGHCPLGLHHSSIYPVGPVKDIVV